MVAMRGGVVVYDHGQRPPLLFGLKVQPECPADALLTTASVADAAARPPPLELCCGPPAAVGPPFRGLEASEPSDADATRTATSSSFAPGPTSFPTPVISSAAPADRASRSSWLFSNGGRSTGVRAENLRAVCV